MTDKSEEQVAKDKEAVDRMRGAQSAMKSALDRIDRLERALRDARDNLGRCKQYVGPAAYVYEGRQLVTSLIDEYVAHVNKALG